MTEVAGVSERRWWQGAVLVKIAPLTLVQLVFFAGPLVLTLLLSFQSVQNYQVAWTWDLSTWTTVFSKSIYWTVLWRTLVMALLTVALCALFALPIAYVLVNRLTTWRWPVQILLIFAFLTDQTLKIFGWLLFLEDNGAGNYLLSLAGLPAWITINRTSWAVVIGMVYTLLPFTIFTTALSMATIDRSLVLAAYDAGASKLRAFWSVTLPLALPGILAGVVLVFLLSIGVFLEPKVLGGGRQVLMAELIRQSFETRVNWPLGAALTFLLLVVCMAILAVGTILIRIVQRLGGRP